MEVNFDRVRRDLRVVDLLGRNLWSGNMLDFDELITLEKTFNSLSRVCVSLRQQLGEGVHS